MTSRRHFGTVRKRPSGRWQAIYWFEGGLHSAGTFNTKADALTHLSTLEADFRRGAWIDPAAGQITVREFATEWLARRVGLSVRTRELYEDLLRVHVLPSLRTPRRQDDPSQVHRIAGSSHEPFAHSSVAPADQLAMGRAVESVLRAPRQTTDLTAQSRGRPRTTRRLSARTSYKLSQKCGPTRPRVRQQPKVRLRRVQWPDSEDQLVTRRVITVR